MGGDHTPTQGSVYNITPVTEGPPYDVFSLRVIDGPGKGTEIEASHPTLFYATVGLFLGQDIEPEVLRHVNGDYQNKLRGKPGKIKTMLHQRIYQRNLRQLRDRRPVIVEIRNPKK